MTRQRPSTLQLRPPDPPEPPSFVRPAPLRSILLLALLLFLPTLSGAQPYPNVQINSRPNGPEETSIAINPRDPMNVVAVAQVPCHYYYSFNGGLSWGEGDLPDPRNLGDPSVTFDRLGNVFYCYIGGWANSGIFVSRSTNGGVTWPATGATLVEHVGIVPFEDKSWPVCDLTSGPHENNVYVSWTRFSAYGSASPADSSWILFSRSTNNGTSYSTPLRISDRGGDAVDSDNTVEGAVPAVGPDGTVYVAWSGPRGIEFDRSTNGGISFGPDRVISDQPGGWDFDIAGLDRANGLPVTKSDISFGPYRGRVYVNWSDKRNGDADIFLIYSDDGGDTWGPRNRVNDDPVGNGAEQFFTWCDVDPVTGIIYVVFYDRRGYPPGSASTDVYLAVSEDGGDTFQNLKISASPFIPNPSAFFGDYTGISAFGGRVRPIWTRMEGITRTIWTALVDRPGADASNAIVSGGEVLVRPNPVRSEARIIYKGWSGAPPDILVVDLEGRIVRRLTGGAPGPDGWTVIWDGADGSGRSVPSGVYSVAGRGLTSSRLILIR
jgi:hypothetical protein